MSGPIKEKDGRIRHFKGVGENVESETTLGAVSLHTNQTKIFVAFRTFSVTM